jgi:hypothetical protein
MKTKHFTSVGPPSTEKTIRLPLPAIEVRERSPFKKYRPNVVKIETTPDERRILLGHLEGTQLPISARCCHGTTAGATTRCYVEWTGSRLRSAKRPANNHRAAHRTGCTKQMSDAPRNSVKRDADRVRPLKSWRQIRLSLIGELGQLELIVLLPLVFTANVIVATIAWFVVGWLLR